MKWGRVYTTSLVLRSTWEALRKWYCYCFKYRIAIKHLPNETTATLSGKKCNLYRISKCTNMMQIAVGKNKTLLKPPSFEWKPQAQGSSYFREAARVWTAGSNTVSPSCVFNLFLSLEAVHYILLILLHTRPSCCLPVAERATDTYLSSEWLNLIQPFKIIQISLILRNDPQQWGRSQWTQSLLHKDSCIRIYVDKQVFCSRVICSLSTQKEVRVFYKQEKVNPNLVIRMET